jgi:hypothetical protein
MRKLLASALAFSLGLVTGNALAIDTSEPILCASLDVFECVDGAGCEEVLPEDVDAPTFLWIDIGNKEIRASVEGSGSRIDHIEEVEDRLVLQGVEDGREDAKDGTGWTISIEQKTGRMVATAAASQAAIIIFGACTEV